MVSLGSKQLLSTSGADLLLLVLTYIILFHCLHIVVDKPEGVQLDANKAKVCRDGVVTFNCSAADGDPVVHFYQLYENSNLVSSSNAGVWNRTMSSVGVFNYTCMANNTVGTAESMNVSITVNGKQNVAN